MGIVKVYNKALNEIEIPGYRKFCTNTILFRFVSRV